MIYILSMNIIKLIIILLLMINLMSKKTALEFYFIKKYVYGLNIKVVLNHFQFIYVEKVKKMK